MFSSRSHTIITICLTKDNEKDRKCYLVDLAGSERLSPANKETKQRKEAKSINQSLSALGNVISALASQSKQEKNSRLQKGSSPCPSTPSSRNPTHVRYRESKLTRLLEKSISGKRGRLVLIGTIDPNAKNLSETISTLKFASRCKSVPTNTSRYDQSSNTLLSQSPLSSPLNIQSMSVESLQRVCLQLQDELSLQRQREKELHLAYQEQIVALQQQIEYFKWNEHVQPPRVPSVALEKQKLSRSKSDNGYITKTRNMMVETHKEDDSDESDDELLELGDQLDSLIEEEKKHTSSKKSSSSNITAEKSVPTRVISLQEGCDAYEKQLLMAKTPLEMMRQSSRILEGVSAHRTEGRETDECTLVSETDSTEYALYASSEDTERDSTALDCRAPLAAVVSEPEVSSAMPVPSSTTKVDPAALYEALHHIAQRLHVTRQECNPPESRVSVSTTKELDSEEGRSVTTEMITALTQEIVCTMSTVAQHDNAQDENVNSST